jgi:hypothetical protein
MTFPQNEIYREGTGEWAPLECLHTFWLAERGQVQGRAEKGTISISELGSGLGMLERVRVNV